MQNNFTKVSNNHTNKQQKAIKTAINACKMTIKQQNKWKYINMNPKAPHLYGTIKLHKADKPIRPIVLEKQSRVQVSRTFSKITKTYHTVT
jgi:uncharacterized protein (DUF952 family)